MLVRNPQARPSERVAQNFQAGAEALIHRGNFFYLRKISVLLLQLWIDLIQST